MAGQTLPQLLAWMKGSDNQVMWGWDAIAALARGKTNTLLIQDYIGRFASESYLPPISGVIELVADMWQEHIHGFVLDAPRLSFEVDVVDGKESVKAMLTLAVMGGSQISMEKVVDRWEVSSIKWISPLQGPKLFLDLQLEQVPGVVQNDGRLHLDLRLANDFRLTFAGSQADQNLGGAFFQELFEQLPDEQRILPLGRIKPGTNPLMRPQSFRLGAQSNRLVDKQGFGEGAVMVFIQMEGSTPGGMPGASYPYLLPADEDKNHSAAVLFAGARIRKLVPVLETVLPLLTGLLGGSASPHYEHDVQGALLKATLTQGFLRVGEKGARLPVVSGGQTLWVSVLSNAMDFLVKPDVPVVLTRNDDNSVRLTWTPSATSATNCIFDNNAQPPISITHRYALTLDVLYDLGSDGSDGLSVRPVEFNLHVDSERLTLAQEVDSKDPSPAASPWTELLLLVVAGYVAGRSTDIEPRIRETLSQFMQVDVSVDGLIEDSIELNFGHAIKEVAHYFPRDLASFGQINPVTTAFTVEPLEPLMFAGMSRRFSTVPQTAVTWSVEPLTATSANPGSIDVDGNYHAPSLADIPVHDGFLRVRITASSGTGVRSSALVTVLSSRLTVNPVIKTCNPGSSVTLVCGGMLESAPSWTIINPEADSGVLKADGNECIYTASPATTAESFLLDVISVSGGGALLPKYAYVLAVRHPATLHIKPDPDALLPPGQLQLRAWTTIEVPAVWSVKVDGNGRIDPATGVFTSNPDAPDRFALIFAQCDSEFGLLEGYLILPLPLADFSDELRLMSN